MRTQRGPDRRQKQVQRPSGSPERRCGSDRRRLQFSDQSIVELEARLAALGQRKKTDGDDDGSGWDKLIISID